MARLLADLMPDEPEVAGLLALLLLTDARRAARTAPDGSLVLLGDQDRSRWDRSLISEGQALVAACLRRNEPGPSQLQAAVNAVHSDAATAADTDWGQILQLYDQLLAQLPTPIVALNRAVAVAEVHGPATALAAVDSLDLDGYHLFHAPGPTCWSVSATSTRLPRPTPPHSPSSATPPSAASSSSAGEPF